MQERIESIFQRNFEERGEVGASVSIWKDGEEVISLHHGWRDREKTIPWDAQTLVPVWSVTKGPAAIATLLALHESGIPFQSPVSDLWPELKAARENRLTFAKLLAHQSGLASLDPGNRPSILNHKAVAAALEKQEPAWEPGKARGYHPRTYGFLLDEIVRRATGGTALGSYWNTKLAEPMRLDFRIGNLTASETERLATKLPPSIQRPNPEELPFYRAIAQPDSIAAAAFASPGGMRALSDINKLEYLQAGLPALGGVGSASSIAKFYHVLAHGGLCDGVQVIPKPVVNAARTQQGSGEDLTFQMPMAYTAGLMKDPIGPDGLKLRQLFGPSERAFGQPGAGGNHAFADPENGISFAYVMNQMETGVLPNRKSLDLVEALYGAL